MTAALAPPLVPRPETAGDDADQWGFLGNVPQQFSQLNPTLAELDVDELLNYLDENWTNSK